jgi:hypothetical protein
VWSYVTHQWTSAVVFIGLYEVDDGYYHNFLVLLPPVLERLFVAVATLEDLK